MKCLFEVIKKLFRISYRQLRVRSEDLFTVDHMSEMLDDMFIVSYAQIDMTRGL